MGKSSTKHFFFHCCVRLPDASRCYISNKSIQFLVLIMEGPLHNKWLQRVETRFPPPSKASLVGTGVAGKTYFAVDCQVLTNHFPLIVDISRPYP